MFADRGIAKYPVVRALPTIEITRENVIETCDADCPYGIQTVRPGAPRGCSSLGFQRLGGAEAAWKLSRDLIRYRLVSIDVHV